MEEISLSFGITVTLSVWAGNFGTGSFDFRLIF